MKRIIIAVDGFSSCGKSTMAKDLAREIGYIYVDTGAMYRAVTLFALRNDCFVDDRKVDTDKLERMMKDIAISFRLNTETGRPDTYPNGENVEKHIRNMEVSSRASPIAAVPFVRKALVEQQQKMGEAKGIVMDGRDIGTTVFPSAELKIYVTASAEVRARGRKAERRDLAVNVETAHTGLFQSLTHEFGRDALDLDIHLESGDAFGGTGNLEVHIAEVIFRSGDIREDLDLSAFGDAALFRDEAHRDARDRGLDGNACIHQRERAAAHGSHRRRAVGFHDVGHDADGVREIFRGREHCGERTLRKVTVTDFAAGKAELLAFTHAVRGEVVVKHVVLGAFALKRFVALFIGLCTERAGHESLGFAALENRGAVSARENADFDFDRADFRRLAAVETHVFVQDHGAHNGAFHVVENSVCVRGEFRVLLFTFADDGDDARVSDHLRVEGCHGRIEFGLDHRRVDVLVKFITDDFLDRGDKLVMSLAHVLRGEDHLRLGAAGDELGLSLAELLDDFVTGENGADHRFFGDFVSAAFDHADGRFRTCDHEVQIGDGHLIISRHHDVLAIDDGDADRGHLFLERKFGETDGEGRSAHAEHIGSEALIGGKDLHEELHFTREVFREHRTDRAVDDARRDEVAHPDRARLLAVQAG